MEQTVCDHEEPVVLITEAVRPISAGEQRWQVDWQVDVTLAHLPSKMVVVTDDPRREVVCELPGRGDHLAPAIVDRARLLAAAPDLFRACEALLRDDWRVTDPRLAELLNQVENAVAGVRGTRPAATIEEALTLGSAYAFRWQAGAEEAQRLVQSVLAIGLASRRSHYAATQAVIDAVVTEAPLPACPPERAPLVGALLGLMVDLEATDLCRDGILAAAPGCGVRRAAALLVSETMGQPTPWRRPQDVHLAFQDVAIHQDQALQHIDDRVWRSGDWSASGPEKYVERVLQLLVA